MANTQIGIVGCGAMGSGIAQVAATAGETVVVFDPSSEALVKAKNSIGSSLAKLVEKSRITVLEADVAIQRIKFTGNFKDVAPCSFVIEAAFEDLNVKQEIFRTLESFCSKDAILATNTSSFSIASVASVCKIPSRVIGIHFFNPPVLMPLVEVIPCLSTTQGLDKICAEKMKSWGKTPVVARDMPGFIVNRVARPFYGEAIRIYEEGIADFATIDWAMKEFGKFKMGPFELMDLIGNDVNYTVTETVWKQFYCDPRYKPSITQKRLFESKLFGKKTGKGYYDYSMPMPEPKKDSALGEMICKRVLIMLINEAIDALYLGLGTKEDIDLAMTKGVNYPKGLLKWADDKGILYCCETMEGLFKEYGEDRYRPSVFLKKMALEGKTFY